MLTISILFTLALSASIPATPESSRFVTQNSIDPTTGVGGFIEGAFHGAENLGSNIVGVVLHPIETINSAVHTIAHPIQTIGKAKERFHEECRVKGTAECVGKATFNVGAAVLAPVGVAKVRDLFAAPVGLEPILATPSDLVGSSPGFTA